MKKWELSGILLCACGMTTVALSDLLHHCDIIWHTVIYWNANSSFIAHTYSSDQMIYICYNNVMNNRGQFRAQNKVLYQQSLFSLSKHFFFLSSYHLQMYPFCSFLMAQHACSLNSFHICQTTVFGCVFKGN